MRRWLALSFTDRLAARIQQYAFNTGSSNVYGKRYRVGITMRRHTDTLSLYLFAVTYVGGYFLHPEVVGRRH